MADLRAEGKTPVDREELMRDVRKGHISVEMD